MFQKIGLQEKNVQVRSCYVIMNKKGLLYPKVVSFLGSMWVFFTHWGSFDCEKGCVNGARTFRRTDFSLWEFSPYGFFALRNFRHTEFLSYGIFRRTEFSPYTCLVSSSLVNVFSCIRIGTMRLLLSFTQFLVDSVATIIFLLPWSEVSHNI